MSYEDFLTRYLRQIGTLVAALIGFREKKEYQLAIDEIEKAGWRIYPNPMDVFVMLSKSSELSSNATVRIFSATGSMVICQDLQAAAGGEFMLKVSHLAAGVYFLELDENNQKLVFKLVKK